MNIWKTESVNTVPSITLKNWRIYKTELNEMHFVGYNLTEGHGRVSSAIITLDKDKMIGVTRSGRVYKLLGEPGHNSDADYTWSCWVSLNKVESYTDVTDTIIKNE